MKHFLLTIICLLSIFTSKSQELEYPITPKQTVVDTFFNKYTVSENYRWLENVRCDSVRNWIDAQNKISHKFLKKAAAKFNSKAKIKKYSYRDGFYSRKLGDYFFSFGLRNSLASAGLYMGNNRDNINQLLIDPNFKTGGAKIDINGCSVSKKSQHLVYMINRNGSDWREIKVVGLPSGKEYNDHLTGVIYSNIAWKDNGFYYSKHPNLGEFSTILGEEVYYHKLGDDQSKDKLIFKRKDPTAKFKFKTTSNERFFILEEETTTCFNYFFIDFQSDKPYLRPLLMKQKYNILIIDSHNDDLIIDTGNGASRGKVVAIDPYKPYQWKVIVPEQKNAVLLECVPKTDKIILVYQSNENPTLKIYDYSGKQLFNMNFPIGSSIGRFDGKKEDENITFLREHYTMPSISYHLNINTFEVEYGKPVNVVYNYKNYVTKSIKYPINDSISVPMDLVYKKGLKLDGNNPCLLETFGGFGAISTPNFESGIVHFIEKGGIYAFANIRGSGNLGVEWAKAGKCLNKQNSINDFNAAAEYLISEGYTKPEKLASTGGFHGGLIVASAAIQRPDLYAATVPIVGVTDMIRFEQFTIGIRQRDEFGSIKNLEEFLNLLSYSPLHKIKENINYPAMLVMTSENDDRIPPYHSYKFVAELQNREAQKNPILLRVEKKSGHYGAINYSSSLKETYNMYDFILRILMN